MRNSGSEPSPIHVSEGDGIRVVVLGNAQDGGVPQMGCMCDNCNRVRAGHEPVKWVSSLALIDDAEHLFWIVDATPDFPRQYDFIVSVIPEDYTFKGMIITHAHIGHYLGLVYLGKEALSASDVPIIGTHSLTGFLNENAPFSQLVELRNVHLTPMDTFMPIKLSDGLTIQLLPVPHRNEFSDTVAIQISGPQSSLLYVPDIDNWDLWPNCDNLLINASIAIIDGTFYDEYELPNRNRNEISHPTVVESMKRFQSIVSSSSTDVYFTHLNHSNCLWSLEMEKGINNQGFRVLSQGEQFEL